jgi:hypothetical protein
VEEVKMNQQVTIQNHPAFNKANMDQLLDSIKTVSNMQLPNKIEKLAAKRNDLSFGDGE